MTTTGKFAGAAALLMLSLACGEATGPAPTMLSIPPPAGWVEQLELGRDAKDRSFRTDPESPLLADDRGDFAGLEYWEPDPSYYFVGRVELYPQPERFTIITTTGQPRPCEKVGWLSFRIGGSEQRLQVYRLLDMERRADDPGFFLPFTDATSGRLTYPAGRYVELDGPPGGPYVLDFNTAYNPYCAYGAPERYACPTTPAENRLQVPIEAGERGYKRHDG